MEKFPYGLMVGAAHPASFVQFTTSMWLVVHFWDRRTGSSPAGTGASSAGATRVVWSSFEFKGAGPTPLVPFGFGPAVMLKAESKWLLGEMNGIPQDNQTVTTSLSFSCYLKYEP